jgi:hypothetical protein
MSDVFGSMFGGFNGGGAISVDDEPYTGEMDKGFSQGPSMFPSGMFQQPGYQQPPMGQQPQQQPQQQQQYFQQMHKGMDGINEALQHIEQMQMPGGQYNQRRGQYPFQGGNAGGFGGKFGGAGNIGGMMNFLQ